MGVPLEVPRPLLPPSGRGKGVIVPDKVQITPGENILVKFCIPIYNSLGKYSPHSNLKLDWQLLDDRYSKVGHGSNLVVWLGTSQIQNKSENIFIKQKAGLKNQETGRT